MKIFSLETKTHLAVWSVVLGLAIVSGLYVMSETPLFDGGLARPTTYTNTNCLDSLNNCGFAYDPYNLLKADYGWPVKFKNHDGFSFPPSTQEIIMYEWHLAFVFDFVFWSLFIFIMLLIAKKYKNHA